MGQYYRTAINLNGKTEYSDRKIECGEYVMAKLMEHSYLHNEYMDAVANAIHNKVARLAWIGDYATPSEVGRITHTQAKYRDCWGWTTKKGKELRDKCRLEFPCKSFAYSGKFLVNDDKKVYISFDNYARRCKKLDPNAREIINPISILTAIGNGRGGGDYHGTYQQYVGKWAWDEIAIVDKISLRPKDYTELKIAFVEGKE